MVDYERNEVLAEPQLAQAVADIPRWEFKGDRLCRSFEFDSFTQAFGFMTQVALIAERLFHHPEWSNVYNRVDIEVTNHDAGGVTELDIEFCRRVSALVA